MAIEVVCEICGAIGVEPDEEKNKVILDTDFLQFGSSMLCSTCRRAAQEKLQAKRLEKKDTIIKDLKASL